MRRYIFTILMTLVAGSIFAQDDNRFSYKPFSIYKAGGQVVIAGNVNTHTYKNYFGKDVAKETYSDVHNKPEYLVYALFKSMKNDDVAGMSALFDSSFTSKSFDRSSATEIKKYNDIRFVSKFRSGNNTVIRYNFYNAPDKFYPYFAVAREVNGKYYLTLEMNLSDPFNLVGSYSPANLPVKAEENISTNNLTPFYFVTRNDKIYFTPEVPPEDHTILYLGLEYFKPGTSTPESEFLKELQQAAKENDSAKMKSLLAATDRPLLADPYYNSFYYHEITKIFRNFPNIVPVAALKTNDGKVLYFKYSDNDQSAFVASIILKQVNKKYQLGLRVTQDDVNNILQNVYVRETLIGYLSKK